MFMFSFRLRRRAVAIGGVALALVLVLGITGIKKATNKDVVTAAPVSDTGEKVKAKKVSGKTNEDRLKFIQSFGWEVEADAIEIMEVIIPKEFDEVYEEYNSMQKKQGYDLSKYAGKRCKRYCYAVTNYPGAAEGEQIRVNILVHDNKIIGGDVCSLAVDGFMHGFTAP